MNIVSPSLSLSLFTLQFLMCSNQAPKCKLARTTASVPDPMRATITTLYFLSVVHPSSFHLINICTMFFLVPVNINCLSALHTNSTQHIVVVRKQVTLVFQRGCICVQRVHLSYTSISTSSLYSAPQLFSSDCCGTDKLCQHREREEELGGVVPAQSNTLYYNSICPEFLDSAEHNVCIRIV